MNKKHEIICRIIDGVFASIIIISVCFLLSAILSNGNSDRFFVIFLTLLAPASLFTLLENIK